MNSEIWHELEQPKILVESYWTSNEDQLFKLFPYIAHVSGSVIAVGSEQGLDLVANSQSQRLVKVDYDKDVNLLTRAILEVGSHFRRETGGFSDPLEFFYYFRNNLMSIDDRARRGDVIEEALGVQGAHRVNSVLLRPLLRVAGSGREILRDVYMGEYMNRRSKDQKVSAWYGSCEGLNKVLDMYERGDISFVLTDLQNPELPRLLDQMLEDPIGIMYLSNIESKNFFNPYKTEKIWENLNQLRLTDDGVILRTSAESNFVRPSVSLQVVKTFECDPVLNSLYLKWHYNAETFEHHKVLSDQDVSYSSNGWGVWYNKYVDMGVRDWRHVSFLNIEAYRRYMDIRTRRSA